MFPANTIFPKFVPDQLLTSEDLNNLFGYLDEQGRITRTNLIGIGIVCGLEVFNNAAGTSITITKGCGVTSKGYLINIDHNTVYTQFKLYNAIKPQAYNMFLSSATTQRFTLWELKETAEETGTTALDATFLADKIVMLFVELLEEQNKNCNPNSCDDKGVDVTVTVRVLVVSKIGIDSLAGGTQSAGNTNSLAVLRDVRMKRVDVPNTSPVTSEDLFQAYMSVLTTSFVEGVEKLLTGAYNAFAAFIENLVQSNPFAGLANSFSFINNGAITAAELPNLQYYYDVFSDLLMAYEEFKTTGAGIINTCCPADSLFPRHLLLGEAIATGELTSAYRHYFTYSPLFGKPKLLVCLRHLFFRIVEMKNSISLAPFVEISPKQILNMPVRFTPSELSKTPLSAKAIPYYYKADPLFKFWNSDKTLDGKEKHNLSYNAGDYNSEDDFVTIPLNYDLEPYNFLRVEGHIGKHYKTVFAYLKQQVIDNRLPIDIILLKTGAPDAESPDTASYSAYNGCNGGLEINYDIVRREWEAIIGKMIEYLDDNGKVARDIIGASVFASFQKLLKNAKAFMVNGLPQFISAYKKFMLVFEKIEIDAHEIRNSLEGALRKNEIAEDLIDHFDEVILSCKKGAFRALYQAFTNVNQNADTGMFFSDYAKRHPGLQHKAGVPMGGSFIIVYHTPSSSKGKDVVTSPKEKISVKKSSVATKEINTSDELISRMGAAFENKYKLSTGKSLKETLTKADYHNFITEVMGSAYTVSGIAYKAFSSKKPEPGEWANKVADIEEGTVIADFYLPYTCCSDCEPLDLEIQEPLPNKLPVADAGADTRTRLPQNKIMLSGANSKDEDGDIVGYKWAYKSGPDGALIKDENAATTDVAKLTEGTYVFTLTVTDNKGATGTDDVTVVVLPAEEAPPKPKECADLDAIVREFNALVEVDDKYFTSFTKRFTTYKEIKIFFNSMAKSNIAFQDIDKQISFFSEQKIIERLYGWLDELYKFSSVAYKLLSLALYRILCSLATYITCILKDDFNNEPLPTQRIFTLIKENLDNLKDGSETFTDPEKEQLKKLLQLFLVERDRLPKEGKPEYSDILQDLIKILMSYKF